MARRFPVTTNAAPTAPAGAQTGGLWRAIAPATIGGRFEDSGTGRAYELGAPASALSQTSYTVGVVYRQVLEVAQDFDNTYTTSFPWYKGGVRYLSQSASSFEYSVEIDGASQTSNPSAAGDSSNELYVSFQDGLNFDVVVVDADPYSVSAWYRNGHRQTVSPVAWTDDGSSVDAFQIGRGSWHHIIGLFFHLDAMTFDEVLAMQWNIQQAKDIPDVDYTGLGTVPDHIWSVKRAMVPGTNGVTNWVSDGATGGITLARTDSTLTVLELDGSLATMR